MNFGRSEKIRYNKDFLPIYGDFLKLCYCMSFCYYPCRSSQTYIIAVDDCHACALPATRAEDEVMDSDAGPFASTPTRNLSLPGKLSQVPPPPPLALSEHADHAMPLAWANDIPQAQTPIPSRSSSPISAPLPPAPTPLNLPPVAISRELSSRLGTFEKQNAPPRTGGNDADNSLPATRNPTSIGSLAHSALMQPKRGLSDEVAMDDGGLPKRGSKRRRVLIRESVEKESSTDKASTSASRPTRQKKGTAPQLPSPSATPWFSEFQKMFLEKDLGTEWVDLVSLWVAFEEQSRSTQVRRLSAAGRPAVVHDWIARRRVTTFQPKILSLEDYESEFLDWWRRLQPTWRISNNNVDNAASQLDWVCLRVPGVNGIMNVVVALFYWGLASEGKSAHHKAWLAAVEDCATAFSLF